jgi:hypothetical protein
LIADIACSTANMRTNPPQSKPVTAPHTVTVASLRCSGFSECVCPPVPRRPMWQWAAVSRYISEKGLLLISIGQMAAVVIPRRSFGSDSAIEAAKALVRARLSDRRPSQVPLDL